MKEGYKVTELGEIPEDWEVVKLGEVGKALIGLTYSPENVTKDGGTLVFRSSNIRGNQIVYKDSVFVNKLIPEHLITKEGDILICARNGSKSLIGKCAIIDEKSIGNSFGAFMSVFRTNHSKYVFHLFQTDWYRNQIDSNLGATINQITTGNLLQFKFPFPPLPEQQKIASILSTVDEKIDIVDEQIKQTQELKKGLMQQLLTKGIGHTKFKSSELGEIPESWEVFDLGSLFKLRSGDGLSRDNSSAGKYPVYGGNGISFYHSEFTHSESKLIIGRVGAYCGCVYHTSEKSWITDNALIVNVKLTDYSDLFMYFLLTNLNLNYFANKNAQPVISGQKIYPIKIAYPPLAEQQKIASILCTVDEKIDSLKSKKQSYKQLKKGLMQQLLTGKVRVKIHQQETSLA